MKNTKRLRKATPARLGLKVAEPVTGSLLVTAHHHQRPGGSVMRP